MDKVAISACLVGKACRYDGSAKANQEMVALFKEENVLIFCPEALGGLSIPRLPAEIAGGDGYDVLDGKATVKNKAGEDVTAEFIQGATRVLEKLKKNGVKKVYLKERSPSCGVNQIYDGTFTGKIIGGLGVTAALLLRNGILVEAR